MKGEKDRVDRLLDKNAAEQLARVDWDRLTDQISARLDRARRIKTPQNEWPAYFKIATGVAAAAAVIFAVVVLRMDGPSSVPKDNLSTPEITKTRGVASVQIEDKTGTALVMVHVGRTDTKAAKCIVDIVDHNGDLEEGNQAAWIIINATGRALADNGRDGEEAELLCLL